MSRARLADRVTRLEEIRNPPAQVAPRVIMWARSAIEAGEIEAQYPCALVMRWSEDWEEGVPAPVRNQ